MHSREDVLRQARLDVTGLGFFTAITCARLEALNISPGKLEPVLRSIVEDINGICHEEFQT